MIIAGFFYEKFRPFPTFSDLHQIVLNTVSQCFIRFILFNFGQNLLI